jgi:hypothetical protein
MLVTSRASEASWSRAVLKSCSTVKDRALRNRAGGPKTSPRSDRVCNRISDEVRKRIIAMVLSLSLRKLATRFTDTGYFVSRPWVYQLLYRAYQR